MNARLIGAACVIILSLLSRPAPAIPVFWELDGTLLQGGTATGSFIYDSDSASFSDISLRTSSDSPTGGLTFTEFAGDVASGGIVFLQSGVRTGVRTIGLWLEEIALTDLTNEGGVLLIGNSFFHDIAEVNCTAPCTNGGSSASNWNADAANTLIGTPSAIISVNTNVPDIALGDGACSLIEAINEAQTPRSSAGDCGTGRSGPNTIELNAEGPYSITSVDNDRDGPNGLPSITTEITINGNNQIIERVGTCCEPPLLRFFHVAPTGKLELDRLTLRRGELGLRELLPPPYYNGGAIYNEGILTLSGCMFWGNHAEVAGAIYNATSGVATITDSIFQYSVTNAISNGGVMSIVRSIVEGGGTDAGTTTITTWGDLTIRDSLIRNNGNPFTPSAVLIDGAFAKLLMVNTTVTDNAGDLAIRASNGGVGEIINSTIANRGDSGELDAVNGGTLLLRNTVVFFDPSFFWGPVPNCAGNVISLGHNISNDDSCNLTAPGDQPNTDPLLGELADNGGPTMTRALLAGSPGIDAGEVDCTDANGTALLTDQRGFPRPVDGNGDGVPACDVGAFEVQPSLVIAIDIEKLTNGNQADSANDSDVPRIAAGNTVTWTYQVTNSGEVAFALADVVVTDSQAGVNPVLDVSSDNGDSILSPGETWSYTASGQALDLRNPEDVVTLVPGCDDARPTYENNGSVTVPGASDSDLSHYCNPDVIETSIVAAVLPASRSVQVGNPATAFGTIINSGSANATRCGISPVTTVPANFVYQTTDPATNVLTGTRNTPANIAAGASQSYVFAFTPTADFPSTDVYLDFDCTNTDPAPFTVGLNTLLLSASTTPVSDIVALAATQSGDGIVALPGDAGANAFAVATVNVGSQDTITASADTGTATLPVTLSICESVPATGTCLAQPASSVTTPINAGATPTFSIFVTGAGTVPFDPANNRIFVRFKDSGGVTRGSTSVAVRTQ